jgi:hypothetical protein
MMKRLATRRKSCSLAGHAQLPAKKTERPGASAFNAKTVPADFDPPFDGRSMYPGVLDWEFTVKAVFRVALVSATEQHV